MMLLSGMKHEKEIVGKQSKWDHIMKGYEYGQFGS
jgi:hypothetical protein